MRNLSLNFVLLLLFAGCAHVAPKDRRAAMREADLEYSLVRDSDAQGLEALLIAELEYLNGPGLTEALVFG